MKITALEEYAPLRQIRLTRMLADIGPAAKAALPRLREWAQAKEPYLKFEAARAVWRIGHDPVFILDFWLKDLDSPSDQARWDALIQIGSLGKEGAVAVRDVLRTLWLDPDNRVRARAAMTLRDIGPEAREALPELRDALADGYSNVREAAAEAIQRINASAQGPATARK